MNRKTPRPQKGTIACLPLFSPVRHLVARARTVAMRGMSFGFVGSFQFDISGFVCVEGKEKKLSLGLFLLLALLLLLQHLLDNLLLLNQEGADDAVAHAVTAPRATVGALDGLLGAGDLGVLAGAEGGDLPGSLISGPRSSSIQQFAV